MTYPTDRRILSYLHAHLRKCSLDQVTEEGAFAAFALKNLQGSLETRGRKVRPSRTEVQSTINRRRCYARIHFLDGQFQAVEFDACATIAEVMEQIQLKIGLRANAPGYAMYQVLGDLMEQAIAGEEKVGDALGSWEKWHEDHPESMAMATGSNKQHYFIFKKHLFLDSFIDMSDRIERELVFHQLVYNLRSDRFPVSDAEAVMLTALKAQIDLGDYRDSIHNPQNLYSMEEKVGIDYKQFMTTCLPSRLVAQISAEEVMTQHQSMVGVDGETAKNSFFNLIKSWPLYRSTIFEVQQSYTSNWPKNLWLAVDPIGIHLLETRTRNLLSSCDYASMIEYSPSNASLMIVTIANNSMPGTHAMSSSKTSKYIFQTHHAMTIATLIRDYTKVLGKEKGIGRRKSVEFDLSTKGPNHMTGGAAAAAGPANGMVMMPTMRTDRMKPSNPPLPPPRPSLSQRQQQMMTIAEHGNLYSNNNHSNNRLNQQPIYGVNGHHQPTFRHSPLPHPQQLPPNTHPPPQQQPQSQQYMIYGQDPGFQAQQQQQSHHPQLPPPPPSSHPLTSHPNSQVHPQTHMPPPLQQQQQFQSPGPQNGVFQPTHRRQKPLSVHYKPSPVIMTDEQQV